MAAVNKAGRVIARTLHAPAVIDANNTDACAMDIALYLDVDRKHRTRNNVCVGLSARQDL